MPTKSSKRERRLYSFQRLKLSIQFNLVNQPYLLSSMKTLVIIITKLTQFFRCMHSSILVHLPQAWAISFAKKRSLPYCLLITEVCNKDATSSTSRRFFAEQHTKSGRISRAFLQAFSYPSITCAANNKYSLHYFTMHSYCFHLLLKGP